MKEKSVPNPSYSSSENVIKLSTSALTRWKDISFRQSAFNKNYRQRVLCGTAVKLAKAANRFYVSQNTDKYISAIIFKKLVL